MTHIAVRLCNSQGAPAAECKLKYPGWNICKPDPPGGGRGGGNLNPGSPEPLVYLIQVLGLGLWSWSGSKIFGPRSGPRFRLPKTRLTTLKCSGYPDSCGVNL